MKTFLKIILSIIAGFALIEIYILLNINDNITLRSGGYILLLAATAGLYILIFERKKK